MSRANLDRRANREEKKNSRLEFRAAFDLLFDYPPHKQIRRQLDAAMLDSLGDTRADAGADEMAGRVAVAVDAGLFEDEQVVHLNVIAFHAGDFADADHFSLAAGQTPGLHDDLDRAGDLLAQAPASECRTRPWRS